MLKYNNMNNFGRVLTTCIYDTIEDGLTQMPVHTIDDSEYQKHFYERNDKGGFCKIVGLKEYQVKPFFDIDPRGEFDYRLIDKL